MSSGEHTNKSSNARQQQGSKSDRQNSAKTNSSEPNWSRNENFDLLEYLQERKEVLKARYGFGISKKIRCPRYYFINDKQSILIILQGDITRTKLDAIVNAANEHMTGGGGVDGIIHRAAGPDLYDACVAHKKVKQGDRLPTGHSRILLSYNMSSTTYYIINTAGPIYNRSNVQECEKELSSCYKTALALANLYDLESIGFTAISCGIFGYPANDGAEVALRTVDKEAGIVPVIVFVLWDDHIFDAWVKKAADLKFVSFDIENPVPIDEKNQMKKLKDSNDDTDQPQSPAAFNSPVRDFSTPENPKTNVNDDIQAAIHRLPSVPDDKSDTQQTDDMELDETKNNNKPSLHTQQTEIMANVSLDDKKSTVNNDSERSSVQETINKSDDIQTTTRDLTSEVTDQKKIDEPNVEIEKN